MIVPQSLCDEEGSSKSLRFFKRNKPPSFFLLNHRLPRKKRAFRRKEERPYCAIRVSVVFSIFIVFNVFLFFQGQDANKSTEESHSSTNSSTRDERNPYLKEHKTEIPLREN